ncbi:hypothetical protein BD770DRAFT_394180 [Pilaira anomala]|nr:hypothetical protein BD770DRAFT_394180 [Pilaira anomala]
MKRNENIYQQQSMNEQQQYYYNPKRPYQHIYSALGYQIPPQQSTLKRQRSNPSYDYSKSQPASVVMDTPTHHERSKSVATEYIDLETNNDAFIYNMFVLGSAATPTPTAEEMFDSNSRQFFPTINQQQQQQQQQEMTNNLTKLPLPQPSKPASMISKTSWTASGPTQPQTSSKLFFDSEVQTLHYQTSSFPTTMAGLNVIPEEENSLYPNQRASIVSDSSNSSEPILTTTHNVIVEQEQEAVVAAAVANWAHPSSSLVYKRQYNDSITSNSSSLDENDRFHHHHHHHHHHQQQQQQGTSHWINSEKVGDEEFWGE